MAFLNEHLRIGLGMAYSKLETGSDVGNYFLLSQANPRLEVIYDTGAQESFKQRYEFYVKRELFRPENNALRVKSNLEHTNYGLSWEPLWMTEGQGFAYGFKFAAKAGTIISEIPDPFNVNGDIATRYSGEGGLSFTWYGQTVAKFPLSLNLEILYSQNLLDNSVLTYYNGLVYRFSLEFDFKKKTLFSGWNLRAFYEYEDVKNTYKNFVDKDIGFMVHKVFIF
ncbi:MAG: hypothetical protein H7328_05335 [Bdellovibrio sp.]|nr:hypothetical protein [Bdellovibrio sp.]